MAQYNIPVIDMSRAKTDREKLAGEIVDGLENIGFLYIDNVKGIDFEKLFQMCKWFFCLPKETKMKVARKTWNLNNDNIYRGYFPVMDGESSRMEAFEFARDVPADDKTISPDNFFYENSVWPEEDGTVHFQKFMKKLYEILHETSLEILRLAAIGLGIHEDTFNSLFTYHPCSTFRILHYPPWEGAPLENAIIEDGKVISVPDHMDSEILTLIHTFHYSGLEILNQSGEWVAIRPRDKSLIMNIGVLLSRMTGGRLKATRHRVIDIGEDRYSVPFFLAPSFDSDVGRNFVSQFKDDGLEHVPEKFGPWLVRRMKHEEKYVEYRNLPDIA